MKDTKRALRRSHRQRIIDISLNLAVISGIPVEDRLQYAVRLYNNGKKCDCCVCNKLRKRYGPTVQERRQECWNKIDAKSPSLTK